MNTTQNCDDLRGLILAILPIAMERGDATTALVLLVIWQCLDTGTAHEAPPDQDTPDTVTAPAPPRPWWKPWA